MKITLQCPVCKSFYENNPGVNRFGIEYDLIYNSDNNITLIDDSRRGHFCVVYFTNYKFDLLFESGLSAIHDLYFREAVASIASSLERFYEYCIEILTFDLNKENYLKIWKNVANQSERQIGAFYFLYFNAFNSLPNHLSEKDTSFRNKVVHKGYFPTKDETFAFTKIVSQIIESNYNKLYGKFAEQISSHYQNYEQSLLQNAINFAKKESKEIHEIYNFEKNPFERTLQTFLFQDKEFDGKNFENIENYIREFYNKGLD